jgi:hypothetical protein
MRNVTDLLGCYFWKGPFIKFLRRCFIKKTCLLSGIYGAGLSTRRGEAGTCHQDAETVFSVNTGFNFPVNSEIPVFSGLHLNSIPSSTCPHCSGTGLPYGLHVRRTDRNAPGGPSVDWWELTTANAAELY